MPIVALETALYGTLSHSTALIAALGGTSIYNKRAPQTPPTKYVVFQWQGGGDENESPNRTRNVVYNIQGVAASQTDAAALDTVIDACLHLQTLTVTGWVNFWCAREGDINYVEENSGGAPLYHCGGLYRIRIDKS
jgi:hypothetical protein